MTDPIQFMLVMLFISTAISSIIHEVYYYFMDNTKFNLSNVLGWTCAIIWCIIAIININHNV